MHKLIRSAGLGFALSLTLAACSQLPPEWKVGPDY